MKAWLEVWADIGQTPPYVLVVMGTEVDIDVFDPQEGRRKIFTAQDYETIFNWLREDEFELVRGRVAPDEEL